MDRKSSQRRNLLIMSSTVASLVAVPDRWTTPLIKTVMLSSHAATSSIASIGSLTLLSGSLTPQLCSDALEAYRFPNNFPTMQGVTLQQGVGVGGVYLGMGLGSSILRLFILDGTATVVLVESADDTCMTSTSVTLPAGQLIPLMGGQTVRTVDDITLSYDLVNNLLTWTGTEFELVP